MAFSTLDFLASSITVKAASVTGFDRLTINTGGSGLGFLANLFTPLPTGKIVKGQPELAKLKPAKVTINRLPGWEIPWKVSPLATCLQYVKHSIQQIPPMPFQGSSGWTW